MKENNEFVEGFKDNSKPRTPGHSPGVGHAVKNNEPKSVRKCFNSLPYFFVLYLINMCL
ncbi:unnamed protein product [Brassica oleracea var. botrytis]|uniref:(rape) hypothetical protein n=1 Tax=Brassica napus TaxID=3708 RepID=A0A816KL75_BRANA|nr:unnamed protein product [Brassica napus]